MPLSVSKNSIRTVECIIRPYIRRTPIVQLEGSEFGLDAVKVILKLELFQHSGSFKARGSFTNILLREVPDAGVVAASGGNHGVAVAFAAMKLKKAARIFIPTVASSAKVDRISEYGAELVVAGDRYADAALACDAWAAKSGAMKIHAYDAAETLVGQGTLALELQEQCPNLDTLLVAVGGGGLIGGIAAWYGHSIKLVAVEPSAAPTLKWALEAGRPIDAPAEGIAADSLAPKRVGELMFPIAQEYVDEVVLVSDDEIRKAQEELWKSLRVITEPGGAAAFAALLSRRYRTEPGETVGVVICGGNTDAVKLDPISDGSSASF